MGNEDGNEHSFLKKMNNRLRPHFPFIDSPTTMLNVTGNIASSMLIAKIVDGKNWLKNRKEDYNVKYRMSFICI